MSFEINPPRFSQTNANKAQALDNEGRGSSGGGGYASGEKETFPDAETLSEDQISFSSQDDVLDIEKEIELEDNFWSNFVKYVKNLIYKIFKATN